MENEVKLVGRRDGDAVARHRRDDRRAVPAAQGRAGAGRAQALHQPGAARAGGLYGQRLHRVPYAAAQRHGRRPGRRAARLGPAFGGGRLPLRHPPLLGTMRTGPDLFNIGVRQPSADWHLGHLFQPRAYVPGSIMPAFPFLFEIKRRGAGNKTDRVVTLPPGTVAFGKVVVARPDALDLVAYLQALRRNYPVLTPEEAQDAVAPAAGAAVSPTTTSTNEKAEAAAHD